MRGIERTFLLSLLVGLLPCGNFPTAAQGRNSGSFPAASARGAARRLADAARAETTAAILSEVWPEGVSRVRLSGIGRGKGIVFSPDLSVPTNRKFYERLGFTYFEDADWRVVLGQIRTHNQSQPDNPVEVLILESHGTNGHGLKLQAGHAAKDARSYLSVGALQERLEGTGIRLSIITACNAGRLFRPHIYKRLNTRTGDPLFLPATLGVVNASPNYDPSKSALRVVYPSKSSLETTNEGDTSELSPAAQKALSISGEFERQSDADATPAPTHFRFVVSDILAQMLLRDPRFRLNLGGYVTKKSNDNFSDGESEILFQQFLDYLDEIARHEYPVAGDELLDKSPAAEEHREISRPFRL
ncbi:MAG TPA: hypothetical protein VGB76_10075 [Pyrinomonadaceae bacterium]